MSTSRRSARARWRPLLVGDHRQLPEIEAGGAFRALVRRGLAIELTENQRQREPWERRALDLIADGHADRAVPDYQQHKRIHLTDTSHETMTRLVDDWNHARQGDDEVMLAHRRDDVAALNQLARERLRDAGLVHGPELELPGGLFGAGDQIVIKRNEPALGISNGDRGHVLAVDPAGRRLLALIDDRQVELGPGFLDDITRHGDPTLLHGYARHRPRRPRPHRRSRLPARRSGPEPRARVHRAQPRPP